MKDEVDDKEFAKCLTDLISGIQDYKWMCENDEDGMSKEMVVYLAIGVCQGIVPKSIAKSTLSSYVKMKMKRK